MDREDRTAREAYIQALLPERERVLYQHALNKVRVITRSMKAAEKEEYLRSDAFRNTLRQIQRRDRNYQGLLRGELLLSGDEGEFHRLNRMIEEELDTGRKIDLAFLRTVERSHVSLEKAYGARELLESGEVRRFFEEEMGRLTNHAENRVVLWIRTGEMNWGRGEEEEERSVVRRVIRSSFAGGLTAKTVNKAFRPGSLGGYLRGEAGKKFPELNSCRNVRTASGETVAAGVRQEAERSERMIVNALEKKFSRERIRMLLEKNPGVTRQQKAENAIHQREKKIRARCWTRFRRTTGIFTPWRGR